MNKVRQRISTYQIDLLKKSLIINLPNAAKSKAEVESFWEELVNKLNSIDGAHKNGMEWRRFWADYRYRMKKSPSVTKFNPKNDQHPPLPKQFDLLLNFMKTNDVTFSKGISYYHSEVRFNELWKIITNRLNAIQPDKSIHRTISYWQNVWMLWTRETEAEMLLMNNNPVKNFTPLMVFLHETKYVNVLNLKSNCLSDRQFDILFEYMKKFPDLAFAHRISPEKKVQNFNMWMTIADELNKLNGVVKSGEKWRLFWNEYKHSCKKKASEIITNNLNSELSLNEAKVVELVKSEHNLLKGYNFPTSNGEVIREISTFSKIEMVDVSTILENTENTDSLTQEEIEKCYKIILDKLISMGESTETWKIITEEITLLNLESDWKQIFLVWCSKVQAKDKKNLNPLEKRLLRYINGELDVLEQCRVCLIKFSTERLLDIFGNENFADKINECAKIVPITENDKFSQKICSTCKKNLQIAFDFKTKCEQSDQQLRIISPKNETGSNDEQPMDTNIIEDIEDNSIHSDDILTEIKIEDFNDIDEHSEPKKKPRRSAPKKTTSKPKVKIPGPPFICEECKSSFNTLGTLQNHLRRHSSDKLFVCDRCGKEFPTQSGLRQHKFIHSKRRIACTLCPYKTTLNHSLKIHMITHTKIRRYACEICPKKFTTNSNLKNHIKRHTGVKSFKCNLCDFRATFAHLVRDHMSKHNQIKSFSCTICDIKFGYRTSVTKHYRKQHPNIPCPKTERQELRSKDDSGSESN